MGKHEPQGEGARLARPGRRWAVWLATGLGVGYLPLMPGTYGSVLGVGIFLLLARGAQSTAAPGWTLLLWTLLLVALSIPIIARALNHFREEDPQVIVLDEVVGQMLALLPLALPTSPQSFSAIGLGAGFLLFRALDAIKPFPIWKLARARGAWGVVADDLGAGLLAAGALALLGRFVRL